uniref:Uncharacterized protein n=1 Tax=Cacopsylla melanoneura TaxID=428564 RepID=A0A8D8QWZ0_9HEMI
MWSIFFIYLFAFDNIPESSAVNVRNLLDFLASDQKVKGKTAGRRKKPLNKYYVQSGVKLKTKPLKVPLVDYLTSFRIGEFADRLENYIERTNIFHNLTDDLATYHLMSGFLTQLDKEFIIESNPQEYSADHLMIPRLHTKHDDTVIVFKYYGANEYADLEDMVNKGMVHMLRQNYKHAILQHFPGGVKESKRIRQVLLISLGISGTGVLVKHEKYKLESGGDKFSKVLQSHLSNHDMGALQQYLDQIIIATKTHIETAADLKNFVEGFLDSHEDFYPRSNDDESIYIPMTRRKNGKNIAYLIRYKVLSSGDKDRTEELEDKCDLEDTTFFEQFPTVDTVRTILLFHKKS